MSEKDNEMLYEGLDEIKHLSTALNLNSSTQTHAETLYKTAINSEDCEFIGRGVSAIVASTILIASRDTGDVRTATEIAAESSEYVTEKRIHRTTKYVSSTLDLGLVLADPHDFIDRIGEKLDIPDEDVTYAKRVADLLHEDGVSINHAARTIAAACVYYTGSRGKVHGDYTQADLANIVDISELTVRNNYRKYEPVLDNHPELTDDTVPRQTKKNPVN